MHNCTVQFLKSLSLASITEQESSVAAGQPYFISDCEPINNFQFFRPLLELHGRRFPLISVPVTPMFYLAWLVEAIHRSRYLLFALNEILFLCVCVCISSYVLVQPMAGL